MKQRVTIDSGVSYESLMSRKKHDLAIMILWLVGRETPEPEPEPVVYYVCDGCGKEIPSEDVHHFIGGDIGQHYITLVHCSFNGDCAFRCGPVSAKREI